MDREGSRIWWEPLNTLVDAFGLRTRRYQGLGIDLNELTNDLEID